MGRKKNKKISCGIITSQQLFDAAKPLYSPACRCGVHGDTKYNRNKAKEDFRRHLSEEE